MRAVSSCLGLLLALAGCATRLPDDGGVGTPDGGCAAPSDGYYIESDVPRAFSVPPGTGQTCARDEDCPATAWGPGRCLRERDGVTWPGGYCTGPCAISANAPDLLLPINSGCPGGHATCIATDPNRDTSNDLGECRVSCGDLERCESWRFEYECTSESPQTATCAPSEGIRECDPFQRGSCGPGRTCYSACNYKNSGWGNDFLCGPACDLFGQAPPDCNCVHNWAGEGVCVDPPPTPTTPGQHCNLLAIGTFCNFNSYCSSGQGCLLYPDFRCGVYCTPENAHERCGPCQICMDVQSGVGICHDQTF